MLNVRQKAFCEYYVACGNATEAAIKAGYSKSYARTRAHLLLKNVEICRYIEKLREKAKSSLIMSAVERREWLTEMIKNKKVKDTDKLKALDILNKMDGEYTEKLEVKGQLETNPMKGLTTEELRKLANG
ncbi:MAG: terminase [Fusobacteriales bacterium]|nr:MAG: terminase [Fusobacteriales bacterium]